MIDPVTGAGIAEALAGISAGMAGQSLSDAYDDRMTGLIDVDDGPQIGYTNWTTDKPSISGDTSGSISDGTGVTPVDAWHDYVENEPLITVSDTTGGVVSGSNVAAFAYSLMEEHPGTAEAVVRAVAPVGIPLAAAVTAVAQAAGVSVDYANLASDVKESLTSALTGAGMIYDKARGLVTAWKDEWGRILFPKRAFDAVSDTIDELGIGDTDVGGEVDYSDVDKSLLHDPDYSPNLIALPPSFSYPDKNRPQWVDTFTSNATAMIRVQNTVYVAFSLSPFTVTRTPYPPATPYQSTESTYEGVTIYFCRFSGSYNASPDEVPISTGVTTGPNTLHDTGVLLLYGTGWQGGTGYPEGTSESDADKYTPSTIPIAGNLATSYDPDTGDLGTEPLVPIHLTDNPEDATGDTTDPIDPTDEDNPGVVNPPIPLPIPDTKPSNPDVPLVNPSIVDSTLIDELVEELANTLDPQAPQSSGVIPVPPLPGIYDPDTGQTTFPSIIPQSGPGFIHVYNPTPAEFVAFGTWLWVTYADATIDKILNNPFDGVIGAHELYATPNRDGSDNIRSAFLTCPTTAALVTNRYSEIDCGTVIVPEFYGNYLDYSPYSQAYIYLPFIGINEVSIDDIVGHAVNIRYRVDSYSGSCIAMIFVAKDGYQNLCYQFAGSCSVEVPMAGGSQAAIKAGMMQAEAYARAAMIQAGANAVGGIGSALMGNVGGVLSSLSGIASNYAQAQAGVEAAKVANKSSVQHSGQFGASHGAMGEKVPFFIIRNPIQVKVVNYNEDYGFPAHKRVIVGGCRGYLRVREVNVISAHATDEEKMAIEMALKGGVYVS